MQVDAAKYTEQKPVMMTKVEAETFMLMLNGTRFDCAEAIKKAERSRSMTQTVKTIIIKENNANIKAACELQQRIGETFNIGGY